MAKGRDFLNGVSGLFVHIVWIPIIFLGISETAFGTHLHWNVGGMQCILCYA